jgi:hypothetical protein
MAQTRFTGPVVSDNGFVGAFTGGTTNLALTGTLDVAGVSTLDDTVVEDLTANGNATLSGTANVIIVPTVDPAVAGALWNDDGTLKVSAGA